MLEKIQEMLKLELLQFLHQVLSLNQERLLQNLTAVTIDLATHTPKIQLRINCYINLNETEKAESAFLESINYAKKSNAKSLEAFALKGLAEMHKQKHENVIALNLLLKAENLCKNTGDLVLNEGIYKEMSENYLSIGRPDLYQTYNKKYFEMRFKREQNELTSINHSINNHNKETLKKSSEIKIYYKYLTIAVAIISLIILVLFAYLSLKTRKQNRNYQREIQKLIKS